MKTEREIRKTKVNKEKLERMIRDQKKFFDGRVKVTATITNSAAIKLKKIALEEGLSASQYIRNMINTIIEKKEKKLAPKVLRKRSKS